jgi:predicted Fe-Mo cluster-binding NifX family protein
MDPRFGRTAYFLIYDEATKNLECIDNSDTGKEAHGAGPIAVQKISELNPDVLITGNGPGGNAARALEMMPVKIYIGAGEMTVGEAYNAFKDQSLKAFLADR